MYWFASMVPEAVSGVFALFSTSTENGTWLEGFYYALNFMLWLLLSPLAVGFLYAVRNKIGNWSLVVVLILWLVVALCVEWRDFVVMVAAVATPTFVCPTLPSDGLGSDANETSTSPQNVQ